MTAGMWNDDALDELVNDLEDLARRGYSIAGQAVDAIKTARVVLAVEMRERGEAFADALRMAEYADHDDDCEAVDPHVAGRFCSCGYENAAHVHRLLSERIAAEATP